VIPIYRAIYHAAGVRAAMFFSLTCLAGALWWGLDLVRTYGLNPGDGGQLAPLPERLAWGGLVLLLGVAFAAGMWLYGSLYAARIEFDPDKKQVHVYTVRFIGSSKYVFNLEDIGTIRTHTDLNWGVAGDVMKKVDAVLRMWDPFRGNPDAIGRPSPVVKGAPWKTVRLAGWRLPLIIDKQGVVLHRELIQILFGDREVAAAGDKPEPAAAPPPRLNS
jgi:hypothetical protein